MARFNNAEDEKVYNKLTWSQKQKYESISREHPNWNHNQILTKLSLDIQGDIMVEEGGQNVNNLTIWELILKQAKLFLEKLGGIKREILNKFDTAITAVKNAIRTGLEYIGDIISRIFNI